VETNETKQTKQNKHTTTNTQQIIEKADNNATILHSGSNQSKALIHLKDRNFTAAPQQQQQQKKNSEKEKKLGVRSKQHLSATRSHFRHSTRRSHSSLNMLIEQPILTFKFTHTHTQTKQTNRYNSVQDFFSAPISI
jgi:hypothetical protein